jgi:hypothetical protein
MHFSAPRTDMLRSQALNWDDGVTSFMKRNASCKMREYAAKARSSRTFANGGLLLPTEEEEEDDNGFLIADSLLASVLALSCLSG